MNSSEIEHDDSLNESARSQNLGEDLSLIDLNKEPKVLPTQEDYSLVMSDKDMHIVHSSFMRHIKMIFIVVLCVFIALSAFTYSLVVYLQSSHGDHYFDVEPFESIHPYKLRPVPRQRVPQVSSDIDKDYQTTSTKFSHVQGIPRKAYTRAAQLMDLVHNVNFKGEFVFDHWNGFLSPENKVQHFTNLLAEEKAYLNEKYQIDSYIHDQIGMCVFVPSYNNAKNRLYLRNLDSIFQQNYKNYHVVYVNDASTDGTGSYVEAYMEENQIPPEKYTIINNEKGLLHCQNIYFVAHNHCKEGEILVMLDGDDSLIGREVFSVLNAVYQKRKVGLTYGQFIVVRENGLSSGWSRQIPENFLKNGKIRASRSFFSSHLKTMYVDLFRKINPKDLQDKNGTFFKFSPDVAYMTPAIEMTGPRLAFINEAQYEYRFDTGINEQAANQSRVTTDIFDKKAYQMLEGLEFAENPKVIHYDKV